MNLSSVVLYKCPISLSSVYLPDIPTRLTGTWLGPHIRFQPVQILWPMSDMVAEIAGVWRLGPRKAPESSNGRAQEADSRCQHSIPLHRHV